MPTRDEKRRREYKERKENKEKNPVVVDVKDDMSDPVRGLPKARI
ncbi:hypothetical protein [Fonticella tunisiensis]|uniref:Uncharacterized protein n=1 Tax=Fonticella tunisiensis TaxID=1096341 RepID=A0A4R7KB35_9CLOT|nr:hypothetical protein [Fonticella tunisiensis]TDT51339.1 hypothetical protein EDD71_11823 [Fonticella tunisiensis]